MMDFVSNGGQLNSEGYIDQYCFGLSLGPCGPEAWQRCPPGSTSPTVCEAHYQPVFDGPWRIKPGAVKLCVQGTNKRGFSICKGEDTERTCSVRKLTSASARVCVPPAQASASLRAEC